MSPNPPFSYTTHVIRSNTLELSELERVLDFSNQLFTKETGLDASAGSYSCLDDWKLRIKKLPEVLMKIQSRDWAEENSKQVKSLHIWLAGVESQHRRYGLMGVLEQLILEESKKNKEISLITVNTYPKTFPGMVCWLTRQGYDYFDDTVGKRFCWKWLC